KKLLTICLLILGSIFISGPVQAYVLQGLHILDLMIEQLGEAKSLYVTQELIFYRLVSQTDIETDETVEEHQTLDNAGTDLPADQGVQLDENGPLEETLQLEETLRFAFPFTFRSDARSSESERIHVVSGDRSITIVDGSIVPAVANRFDLYKDIFLYRTREDISERLLQVGVDVSISSLGRFEGEISLVLGAVYPDKSVSQIWIDRETFLPTRWIIRGNGENFNSDVLEVRYLTWWKSGQVRYPSRIEFYQDGQLVRVNQLKSFHEGDEFSEDLFDIDNLRSVYPLAPEQPLVPGESEEEPSEVQKTIDEFRKVFE
ncbi:hypothetical protein N9219_04905, partial [bacterium]|nr:hypothetical protein [bacterium]